MWAYQNFNEPALGLAATHSFEKTAIKQFVHIKVVKSGIFGYIIEFSDQLKDDTGF